MKDIEKHLKNSEDIVKNLLSALFFQRSLKAGTWQVHKRNISLYFHATSVW